MFGLILKVRGAKGPIFEDGPDFEVAFSLFHGQNGVVPLAGRSFEFDETRVSENTETGHQFDPLAAKAATISLSTFGLGSPFTFDSLSKKRNKQSKKPSNYEPISQVFICFVVLFLMIYSFPINLFMAIYCFLFFAFPFT